MKTHLLLILSLSACLFTSCMTTTDYDFTGSLTMDGKKTSLNRRKALLAGGSASSVFDERRYLLEGSDCILMLRTPRAQYYTNSTFLSPSNNLGVFLLHGSVTNEAEADTPLHG